MHITVPAGLLVHQFGCVSVAKLERISSPKCH